jgi:plastocyanin
MPGGSSAPILVALGAGSLFLGLVAGGLLLWVGVAALVLTLLIWFREAIREYDRLEPRRSATLPAIRYAGPPPGVHMPGPSIRPLLGALGSAALLGGLVVGGWVLILAVVFLVWTLLGWLFDFTAEYRKVEEADRTGHLENIPDRRLPARTLQVFAVLFAIVGLWQLGVFPPASPATAGPGASGAPPSGLLAPPGALEVVAKGTAYDKKTLEATAGKPFTILFKNEDPPAVPHDIDIQSSDGATIKDQPHTAGGASAVYQYDALEAGEYVFICSVHPIPQMTGTLTVK